jgi:uncharacterized membrane protein YkvA (DUF1232 family)
MSARYGPIVTVGKWYSTVMFDRLKQWARSVKRDAVAVWIAARDPRVPWYAKVVAAATAAYALSPIDLIPDFIPVIGYLDDFVIVPLGIALTIRMIPDGLMQEFRAEAARREARPTSVVAAVFIVVLWCAAIALTGWWLHQHGFLRWPSFLLSKAK